MDGTDSDDGVAANKRLRPGPSPVDGGQGQGQGQGQVLVLSSSQTPGTLVQPYVHTGPRQSQGGEAGQWAEAGEGAGHPLGDNTSGESGGESGAFPR